MLQRAHGPWLRAPAALALLGAASSCVSRPPCAASDVAGTVRASTPRAAQETLALLAELRPAVETLLGASADVSLEVWVRDLEGEALTCNAFTERHADASAVIHLHEDLGNTRRTLAHELVHASRSEALRALPPLLEEGLAEWVAARVAPADARSRVEDHVHVAAYFDAMRLSLEVRGEGEDAPIRTLGLELHLSEEPDALQPEELFAWCDRDDFRERITEAGRLRATRFYSLAELCAERIVERAGLDGLHRLAERAASAGLACVPWPWIAQASGLEDRDAWLAAASARLTAADVRELAELQPGLVVAPLASTCTSILAPMHSGASGTELLRRTEARLVFASGEALPLTELEPLTEALEAAGDPAAAVRSTGN